MIIDTDMAPDAWVALLYLLSQRDVQLDAITVIGAGDTHCAPGVQHALQLLDLAGAPADIPVACGREAPLSGSHTFPDTWREATDGFMGLSLPPTARQAAPGSAVDLLTATIEAAPEPVTIVVFGPLTNIAEVFERSPWLAHKVEIYMMGGALTVPGNLALPGTGITDNTVAEWNIYVDPHAANIVLASDAQITMIPLDATNHAPLTLAFYQRLAADHQAPSAAFVHELLRENVAAIGTDQYYLWDAITATIATHNEIASFHPYKLRVVEEEGPESGRTVVTDQERRPARVALGVQAGSYEDLLLAGLNGRSHSRSVGQQRPGQSGLFG